MANRLDLMAGKARLEQVLDQIGSNQRELELSVYGLLSSSRMEYTNKQEIELDGEIDYLLNSSFEDFDSLKKLDTKSRFLLWLKQYGHAPAYIVALNFDPESEHEQHRFRGEEDHIFSGRKFALKDLQDPLKELGYKDGAILVKPNGEIYTVRSQLTNIDPKAIYVDSEEVDLNDSGTYGFKETVNVRHFSALGASFHLQGLITYTLSEETGNIRRLQKGKITYSTLEEEFSN
jgi:hypothetical protein